MSQPDLHDRSAWGDRHNSEDSSLGETGNRSAQIDAEIEHSMLLRELVQLQELDEERVARIYHLEQALDQALLCIEELRVQIRDQSLLESQLAATEEFSSIQQKAIARLRMQVEQQQRLIENLTLAATDTNEHHALLQETMGVLQAIATQQGQDFTQFQACQVMLQSEAEKHAHRLDLENSKLQTTLDQRDRQILALEAEALTAHAQVVRLQSELDAALLRLRSLHIDMPASGESASRLGLDALLDAPDFSLDTPSLPPSLPVARGHTSPSVQQELSKMQAQIEGLELQLSKQMGALTRWQQRCLELEAESQRYQGRATETQQQIAEMQEEILRQTKQAGEYEAAIQHWKDRYLQNRRNLEHLRELLDRVIPSALADSGSDVDLDPALLELLAAIQAMLMPEAEDELSPTAVPSPHFNALDLPDFLIRRRRYRKKIHPPSPNAETQDH